MEKKAKLKIAVLTEIINSNSGARAPLEVARHLKLLGYEVIIYAYDYLVNYNTIRDLEKTGLKISVLPKPKFKLSVVIPLYKILKRDQNRIAIFSGTLPFFIAAWLAGLPIIRMYHGTQFDAYLERFLPNYQIPLPIMLLNKIVNLFIFINEWIPFRMSNDVVAVSSFTAHEGEENYHRHVKTVIYNGTTRFNIKIPDNTPENMVEILSVSRLTPYKGFHLLIEYGYNRYCFYHRLKH